MKHIDPNSDTVAAVRAFLKEQEDKTMLRFLTCGSVDDGKSTLIGRLLYDTKLIFEDQLAALEKDSKKHGTTGDELISRFWSTGWKQSASRASPSMLHIGSLRRPNANSLSPTRPATNNIPATWRPVRRLPISPSC
jgi:hypothetical protein